MATYSELADLERSEILLDRTKVACWVQADVIRQEAPATENHANRIIWAANVYKNPNSWAERLLRGVLAANAGVSEATILAASDASFLNNVAALVDVFADGVKE